MKTIIIFEPERSVIPEQIHTTKEIICEADLSNDYSDLDLAGIFIRQNPELYGTGMCGVTIRKENAKDENFFVSIDKDGSIVPWY